MRMKSKWYSVLEKRNTKKKADSEREIELSRFRLDGTVQRWP